MPSIDPVILETRKAKLLRTEYDKHRTRRQHDLSWEEVVAFYVNDPITFAEMARVIKQTRSSARQICMKYAAPLFRHRKTGMERMRASTRARREAARLELPASGPLKSIADLAQSFGLRVLRIFNPTVEKSAPPMRHNALEIANKDCLITTLTKPKKVNGWLYIQLRVRKVVLRNFDYLILHWTPNNEPERVYIIPYRILRRYLKEKGDTIFYISLQGGRPSKRAPEIDWEKYRDLWGQLQRKPPDE